MADNELTAKLQKQIARNDGDENIMPTMKVFNPYTEFKEFTRKQIQSLEKTFKMSVFCFKRCCNLFLL